MRSPRPVEGGRAGFLTAAFLACSASSAIAQSDSIDLRVGKPAGDQIEITSMTYLLVRYEVTLDDGTIIPNQQVDAPNVRGITLGHRNNRPFELSNGDTRMNQRDYSAAVQQFEKVVKGERFSRVAKEYAQRQIIECHLRLNKPDDVLKSIQALRDSFPESFYLVETYDIQYDVARLKGDEPAMAAAVEALSREAQRLNRPEMQVSAGMKKAELSEFRKQYAEALAIYEKHQSDALGGEEAQLGRMRCLSELGRDRDLFPVAEGFIREEKKTSPRLLMGAYNARGDVSFRNGRTKEALLDYLRVALHWGPRTGGTPEYEAGIGKAAIASAKFSGEQEEPALKETYLGRAAELIRELRLRFGADSRWHVEAENFLQEARGGKR